MIRLGKNIFLPTGSLVLIQGPLFPVASRSFLKSKKVQVRLKSSSKEAKFHSLPNAVINFYK